MSGNYSNYGLPPANTTNRQVDFSEIPQKNESNKKLSNDVNSKTVELSQQIIPKTEVIPSAATKPLTDLTAEERQANSVHDSPPEKAHSLGVPVILHREPDYDHMTLDQLYEAAERPNLTSGDIDKIFARIDELEAKANQTETQVFNEYQAEAKSINTLNEVVKVLEDNIPTFGSNFKKLSEADVKNLSETMETANISAKEFLSNYQDKYVVKDGYLEDATLENIQFSKIFVDKTTGDAIGDIKSFNEAGISRGVTLTFKDPRRNETEGGVTINNTHHVSEEEMREFRSAFASFIVQMNLLNQQHEEAAPAHKHAPMTPLPKHHETSTATDNKDAKKVYARDERPTILNTPMTNTKTLKEVNEKRIKEFTDYMDQKLQKIKKEVNQSELNRAEVDSNNQKTSNKRTELEASNTKLDTLYKRRLLTIRNANEAVIPLATIKKLEPLETRYQQLVAVVPHGKNQSKISDDVLMETINLKQDIIDVINTIVDSDGSPKQSGMGHEGRTNSPAA